MKLLVIDPGTKSGWAYFENGSLMNYGVVCGNPDDNFVGMKGLFNIYAPDHFVVESQYLPAQKSRGIMTLIESRFTWKTLARVFGCTVYESNPSVWQSFYKLCTDRKIKSKTKRKADFKERIRIRAEMEFNSPFTQDASDAGLIGKWYLTQLT